MQNNTRAQQEEPPSRWNTRWYRFRLKLYRLTARLLGMPRPHDVNTALKNERWKAFRDAREHYLEHCGIHPEERLQRTERGYLRCCQCWADDYFKRLDSGPITDPHAQVQVRPVHFPGRPIMSFNQARAHGAGVNTAAIQAIPKLTRRLDTPEERRQA